MGSRIATEVAMHLAFSLQLKRVGRRARAGMERTNLPQADSGAGLSRGK